MATAHDSAVDGDHHANDTTDGPVTTQVGKKTDSASTPEKMVTDILNTFTMERDTELAQNDSADAAGRDAGPARRSRK